MGIPQAVNREHSKDHWPGQARQGKCAEKWIHTGGVQGEWVTNLDTQQEPKQKKRKEKLFGSQQSNVPPAWRLSDQSLPNDVT